MAVKKNFEGKYYRVSLFLGYDDKGKRKYKYFYGEGKRDAERKRDDYKNGVQSGINYDLTKQTIQAAMRNWMDVVIQPSGIKESTMMRYNHIYNLTKPIWMIRVSEVMPLQIQSMVNGLNSYPKAKQVYKLLNRFFTYCMDSGYLIKNPMRTVSIPDKVKQGYVTKEVDPFSAEEQLKLLDYARNDNPLYYCILALLFKYGARVGEVLALSVYDIDFKEKSIRITSTLSTVKTEAGYENIKERPKNKSSARILYFDHDVEKILRLALSIKRESIVTNDYLFVQRSGKTIFSSNLLKYFYKIQDKLSIPRRTIHSIRHTFITDCYYKGIDEMTVQAIIGHSKGSKITREIYTHLRKDDLKQKMLEAIK